MWRLYFCTLMTIVSASAEIITLLERNNVTCVLTGTSVNSPVYMNPPIRSDSIKIPSIIDEHKEAHGWNETKSLNSNIGPVTDKRWQDFKMSNEETGAALLENIVSFSIWGLGSVYLRVMDTNNSNEKLLNISYSMENNIRDPQWFHFSLSKKNNSIFVLSEKGSFMARKQLDFDPYWFYFKTTSSHEVFWKLHDYSFRSADTVTKEKFYFDVNLVDNLCLSMYVSVDKDCFLNINLEINGKIISKQVIGFNKPDSPKTWQKVIIKVDSPGKAKLSFFRGRQQKGKLDGYWAIDEIKVCGGNLDVYKAYLKDSVKSDHICQILGQSNLSNTERNILTCEKPGFIGTNCSVSCQSVLGKEYSYCEKQKICQSDSTCFCSSGYHGEFCDQPCTPGTWGLFCQNNCSLNCNCHSSSGKCLDLINSTSETPRKRFHDSIQTDERKNFTDQDLPMNVTLLSNKIYIYTMGNKEITYSVKYQCVSVWCRNEIVENDTFTISSRVNSTSHIIRNIKNLTPFTEYRPIINIVNENLNKKYDVFTPQVGTFSDVQNLTVYCSNSSTLWFKFRVADVSNIKSSQYRIWYQAADKSIMPKNVNHVSPCTIWDTYVCGRIDSLKEKTFYLISVEDTTGSNWTKFSTIQGFTAEQASMSPENLRVFSSRNYEAVIQWDYPLVTNGHLYRFIVEVSDSSKIESYTYPIGKPQKTYNFTVPITYHNRYKISVYGYNSYEGKKNTVSAYFLPSNPEFGSKSLVETCSAVCKLLIPKPDKFNNSRNYSLFIAEMGIKKEDIQEVYKIGFIHNVDLNLIVNNFDEDYIEAETGEDFFLGQNKTHTLYLVLLDTQGNRMIYSVTAFEKDAMFTTPVIIVISGLSLLLLFLIVLLILFKRKILCRKQKLNVNISKDSRDLEKLISKTKYSDKLIEINLQHLEHYLEDTVLTEKALILQFRSLPSSTKSTELAFHNKNKNKNRYLQYVPYDTSRVVLEPMEGMGYDDYINASYIDGLEYSKAYIATQGPKFSTVRDFWRMIWQQRVETIIMATNFMESKQRKCAEYFPQRINTIFECGQMAIKLTKEEFHEHYNKRIFVIYYTKYSRKIHHFHLKWNPDDNNPLYADCVVPVIKQMSRAREKSSAPIVVHCSSGSNRTGTLILCDLALEMAKNLNRLDFHSLIRRMRDQRPNMICSEKQYILAHLIVSECLIEPEKIFNKNFMHNLDLDVLKQQLNCLKTLSHHDKIVQSWRKCEKMVENYKFVYRFVDGYDKTGKYLVVQQPPKESLFEFWSLVIKNEVQTVLFLDEAVQKIYPFEYHDSSTTFKVEEQNSLETRYCTFKNLLLSTTFEQSNQIIFEHTILYLQIKTDNEKTDLNGSDLIDIIDYIHKNGDHAVPILVACHDGITKCGTFVTLSYFSEKFRMELVLDMCGAIRTVHRSGTEFTKTTEQLAFLYKVLSHDFKKIDPYASLYNL